MNTKIKIYLTFITIVICVISAFWACLKQNHEYQEELFDRTIQAEKTMDSLEFALKMEVLTRPIITDITSTSEDFDLVFKTTTDAIRGRHYQNEYGKCLTATNCKSDSIVHFTIKIK